MIYFDFKNAHFNVGDNLIYYGERLIVVYIKKNDIILDNLDVPGRYYIEQETPIVYPISKDRFCASFRISRI